MGGVVAMTENGAIVEFESRQDAAPTIFLLAPWGGILPRSFQQKSDNPNDSTERLAAGRSVQGRMRQGCLIRAHTDVLAACPEQTCPQ